MVEDQGYDKRLASALQLTTLLFLCFLVFFARWFSFRWSVSRIPGGLDLVWFGMVWCGLDLVPGATATQTLRGGRTERDPDTGGITETTIPKKYKPRSQNQEI